MPSQKDRVPILAEGEDRNSLQEGNSRIVSMQEVNLTVCFRLDHGTRLAWQLCYCNTNRSRTMTCPFVAAQIVTWSCPVCQGKDL